MPDPINDTPETAGQPADIASPPASTSSAPTLTAESVNQMIAAAVSAAMADVTRKAQDAAAAASRRAVKGKPQTPAPVDPETTAPSPVDEARAMLALRDDFDAAIEPLALTAKQKSWMRRQIMAARPDDVAAHVAELAEVMGVGTSAPPSAPQHTQPQTPISPAKPTLPPPAPPSADREGDPAFRALPEDVARDTWQAYVRRKGANPGNPYDSRNRAAWRELRRRFEAEASITSVQLGARRG